MSQRDLVDDEAERSLDHGQIVQCFLQLVA